MLLSISNLVQYSEIESDLHQTRRQAYAKSEIMASRLRDTYYTMRRLSIDESIFSSWKSNLDHASGRFFIVDSNQRVVLDSAFLMQGKQLKMKELEEVIENGTSSSVHYRSESYQNLLYTITSFTMRDGGKGAVLMVDDINDIFLEASELYQKMILVGGLFMGITSILGLLAIGHVLAPLEQIRGGVEAMTRGRYDHRLPVDNSTGELNQIARSFNAMASRLDEVESQQARFVSNVSHELKTPIASMKIISQSLLQSDESIDPDVLREFLQDIDTESDRMYKIVDDLLYMATLEKRDMKLNLELRVLNKVIHDVLRMLRPLAREKNIELEFNSTQKYTVEYDFDKMKQVLINLVNNAIKYSPENTTVSVHLKEDKNQIYIEVEDQGFGIPEDELPYVFDRFYRVDKARSRQAGGTGLGLNISKKIIQLHGGVITAYSTLNEGSSFIIQLPKRFKV